VALGEDAFAAGELHDVPDNEKEAGQLEPLDDRQLVVELVPLGRRQRRAPARGRAGVDLRGEIGVGGRAIGDRVDGERRLERAEAELALLGERHGRAEARGIVAPALAHGGGILEVPLAVGAEAGAHLIECLAMPQAGQHIVDHPARGLGVVDIVGHDPGDAGPVGERDETGDEVAFLGAVVVPAFDGEVPRAEDLDEAAEGGARAFGVIVGEARWDPAAGTAGQRQDAGRVLGDPVEWDRRESTRRVHAGARDQRRDVAVARVGLGEQHQVRGPRIDLDRQLGADDRMDPERVARLRKAHSAAQIVVIGQRQRGHAERLGALGERFGGGGSVEEGESGVAVELDVVGHAWRRASRATPAGTTVRRGCGRGRG
jgi:hypothetical protein